MSLRPSSRLFILELIINRLSKFLVYTTSISGYVAISLLGLIFY